MYISNHGHMKYLEDFLKPLQENGLKILPKKCQLTRTNLQHMCNILSICARAQLISQHVDTG